MALVDYKQNIVAKNNFVSVTYETVRKCIIEYQYMAIIKMLIYKTQSVNHSLESSLAKGLSQITETT